jgi:hypothetical protein
MAQSGHRKMACSLDGAWAASWWTVGGRSVPSELEDAMTVTAEIQALDAGVEIEWITADAEDLP